MWRIQQPRETVRSAFTLIEVLIVVVILGILASIAALSFGSASRDARESVIREELRFMRTQLALYKASHMLPAGINPATGLPDSAVLAGQLTKFTDYYGNSADVRDAVYSIPPYLSQLPKNPFTRNDAAVIKLVDAGTNLGAAVDERSGWIYCPESLEFCANSITYGPSGKNW